MINSGMVAAFAVTGTLLYGAMGLIGGAISTTGIVVHEVAYADGEMTQNRTVEAGNTFYAVFSARIYSALEPGTDICEGNGFWGYAPGYLEVTMSVDEWVREDGCLDKLPRDTPLIACATWKWGEDDAALCSTRFEIEGSE